MVQKSVLNINKKLVSFKQMSSRKSHFQSTWQWLIYNNIDK